MKLAVKVPLALVLVTVTVGAISAALLHAVMTSVTDDAVRATALSQLGVARTAYQVGAAPEFARLDDPALPEPLREVAVTGRYGTYVQRSPAVVWAAIGTAEGPVLSVRTDWTESLILLRSLDRSLIVLVGVLAALAALLALAVTGTLSRRLVVAERTARAIADGDLSLRVGDSVTGRDEVAELARTIDVLAASMQERLASEKRVTADIAHDLRTPLTGMLTAAELLPEGRPTEMVRSQARRLWGLVEDLLEVARLDAADQVVDLEQTTTADLARRGVTASGVPDVDVQVLADAAVTTDPRRVERVLVNLLANAALHGATPIRCEVDGHRIRICDQGPGFPAELLADGPRRFRTGTAERGTGHGLGLTIATGQARAVSARLTFANPVATHQDRAPATGAVATLELPDRAG